MRVLESKLTLLGALSAMGSTPGVETATDFSTFGTQGF